MKKVNNKCFRIQREKTHVNHPFLFPVWISYVVLFGFEKNSFAMALYKQCIVFRSILWSNTQVVEYHLLQYSHRVKFLLYLYIILLDFNFHKFIACISMTELLGFEVQQLGNTGCSGDTTLLGEATASKALDVNELGKGME